MCQKVKKAKRKREQPKTEKETQGPFQVWVCDSAADGPKLKMERSGMRENRQSDEESNSSRSV